MNNMALKRNNARIRLVGWAILIGGLSMLLVQTVAARDINIPNIDPPPLIQCKNDANCDRDPKHLEAFVAGFYEWYVANLHEFDALGKGHLAPKERRERIVQLAHNEDRVMSERLTGGLRAWHDMITSAEPGTYRGDAYHCPTETDFLLCLQDWDADWAYHAFAQAGQFEGDSADVLLILPVGHHFDNKNGPFKRLIHLKVEDGVWKIDGVIALEDERI